MDIPAYRRAEARLWAEAGASPTEQVVRLPRHEVDVRVMAVGDGPPVLFVHGGPSAGASWASLAGRLSGFRRLVIDRPGTGLSAPYALTRSNVRDFLETFVVDVLDALELDKAHLVGCSTGSDLILMAGAHHPDRVDRSFHLGCPGLAPGVELALTWRLMSLPGMWRVIAAMPASDKSIRSQLRQIGHGASLDAGRISQAATDWTISLARDTDTMKHELRASRALVSVGGAPKHLVLSDAELGSIASPTYFLWGERDPFGGPSIGRAMAGRMPDARLEVVPDGGHLPWIDDPVHASRTLARHLEALDAEALDADAPDPEPSPVPG